MTPDALFQFAARHAREEFTTKTIRRVFGTARVPHVEDHAATVPVIAAVSENEER